MTSPQNVSLTSCGFERGSGGLDIASSVQCRQARLAGRDAGFVAVAGFRPFVERHFSRLQHMRDMLASGRLGLHRNGLGKPQVGHGIEFSTRHWGI